MTTKQEKAADYRDTLNLPRTDFPMRGNLPKREPERMQAWEERGLQQKIFDTHRNDPKWVLHDGPPYANGDIHLGHALNKTLKDVCVRYKTMKGHYVKYVPGFDCHGLPIEQKALEALAKKNKKKKDSSGDNADQSAMDIRRLCHDFATRYIGVQTDQFKRLGVGGAWEAPYLTLDPKTEARSLRLLRDMVAGGYVYNGLRPVYWDPVFRTALAEAEIEYEDHESPSIYVRFPILNSEKCEFLRDHADAKFVIWTTTPWTMPGNMAVCLHPELDYVLVEVEAGETFVLAEGLANVACEDMGVGIPKVLGRCKGRELEGLACAHPLFEKTSAVILGEHVTLEQGTGCVHTAPAHGAEDFYIARAYGIETYSAVDEAGCFNENYEPLKGVNVWKANPQIVDTLRDNGRLVANKTIRHQYPHSWRSHKPIIFRATEQWFVNMEHDDLRARCLKAIDETQWVPRWGHDRIYNMIDQRPDWCLSRQRAWGIPIPAIYSVKADKSILPLEVLDRFIEKVEEHGTDCWFTLPLEEFLPEGFVCPESGGTEFEKEFDILDVWFDSGSTHASVLEADEELQSPADLYLEGSDQHRGWFHHALITSVAGRDRAPFHAVLTHGFLLDEKGVAMSKSKGNVISPLKIMDQMGADVLRLWVASEDYRADMKASDDIFKGVSESYRRIRNTLRYLLGALSDFDPSLAVSDEKFEELDRWAMWQTDELIERLGRAYEEYEFHRIYHLTKSFCVRMSGGYLDMVKDRLYCSAPDDATRRAAQTVLYEMFSGLTRALAPVIPFTADEAWEAAFGEGESVHTQDFPVPSGRACDDAFKARWNRLDEIREIVARALEDARAQSRIGKALEAAITLRIGDAELLESLKGDEDLLRQFFIVSRVHLEAAEGGEIEAVVDSATGEKCERCWNWTEDVGQNADHPTICARCADVVERLGA